MTPEAKADAQKRLARISGQVEGLRLMLAEDRYCVDILTQVAAVRGALDKLSVLLLASHIETCVAGHNGCSAHPEAKSHSKDELIEEVRETLGRFLK